MAPPMKETKAQLAAEVERKKRADGLATRDLICEQERELGFLKNLERLRAERRERERK